MKVTVSDKNTLLGSELKLMGTVWSKIQPTRTSKGAKHAIVRFKSKETFKRSVTNNDFSRKSIYEKTYHLECIIPESKEA